MSKINETAVVKRQYKKSDRLNTRISIHDKYSTNKLGFGNWIFSNYKSFADLKILELGCGTGAMWKSKGEQIAICSRLVLTDFSEAMVQEAKKASESTATLNTPLQTFKISRIATKPLTL